MIPVPFEHVAADSVDAAIDALARHGDDAKVLAGGHSLIPLMKLRLATPAVLIDLGRLDELRYVRDGGDHVAVGALTAHRDVERSAVLANEVPILAHAAGHVGDPQVRNRGTIGGSVAHGDGAADLPAVLLALGATMVVRGPGGERTIPADDFFVGFLETALAPGELLTEIRLPKVAGCGWSFQKFNRRAIDWAIVGVAVVRRPDAVGIGLVNMAPAPVRAAAAEAALAAGVPAPEAAMLADEGTEPGSDLHGSSEYRRHLARVLLARALAEAG